MSGTDELFFEVFVSKPKKSLINVLGKKKMKQVKLGMLQLNLIVEKL
jgi:hypothetical protein